VDDPVDVFLVTASNADLLDAVSDGIFDHDVRREYVDLYLADPRNLLLVAVVKGIVVGMVSGILYTHPDKPLQLFVNELGVTEAYQRMGIGKLLVQRLLVQATARGCAEAWVATEEGNVAARALYVSASAEEDPERAVVYTWSLAALRHDRSVA
jgi:aminoglycoside 6'-N-acetyltransferase I